MGFEIDLAVDCCKIRINSNKTASISAKFGVPNVSGISLNMEDSLSVSNRYRWYWYNASSFYITINSASCTDPNYKIDGYTISYVYTITIGGETEQEQFSGTTQIQGATGQAIINLSDIIGSKLVWVSVVPNMSSSGGGGGPSSVTGNVWVYPDQNAGSILFNGGTATSHQGNIYSYTFSQGTNIQLQAVPALGYEFLYWNDNITLNPWNIGNRVESFGATATFQLIPQTKGVNIYQNGSWQNTGAVKKYENGEWVDLPAHIFRNGQWEDL